MKDSCGYNGHDVHEPIYWTVKQTKNVKQILVPYDENASVLQREQLQ